MSATEIRPSTYWRHEIVPSTSSASSSQSSSAASAASSSLSSAASALVIRRWTKQYSSLRMPSSGPLPSAVQNCIAAARNLGDCLTNSRFAFILSVSKLASPSRW